MTERLFHNSESIGSFHTYKGVLIGKGTYTLLHAHEHDHMVRANKPIGVYRVGGDMPEEVHIIGIWDKRLVAAHVQHMLFALCDGETEYECEFSFFDENGPIGDPKEASLTPYSERCDLTTLPEMVRKLLENFNA